MSKFKTITILIIGLLIASLSGCATHLSEEQCRSMNWHQMGFNDADQGHNSRDLSQYTSDCAKFNIAVNTTLYQKGWDAGARDYCQPNKGFDLGANGENYSHICPANLAAKYKHQWQLGLDKYWKQTIYFGRKQQCTD